MRWKRCLIYDGGEDSVLYQLVDLPYVQLVIIIYYINIRTLALYATDMIKISICLQVYKVDEMHLTLLPDTRSRRLLDRYKIDPPRSQHHHHQQKQKQKQKQKHTIQADKQNNRPQHHQPQANIRTSRRNEEKYITQ